LSREREQRRRKKTPMSAEGSAPSAAAGAAAGGFDARTVATVQKLPLLSVRGEEDRRA
jgi:hypothetical protein